jgi:ParB family chromosome partitioning protein
MTADKPRRLGRGLEALLAATSPASAPSASTPDSSAMRTLPLAHIRPNPYQPRKEFKPEELADLEASLKASGLLQPITVRKAPAGQGFELIAGERRFRAATRLGWTEIPAVVRDVDDRTLLVLAMVENLQRTDLNPLEEAEGYQRLIEEFDLTQQQAADVIGKDRSTIANMLRLLHLPATVRRMLQESQITLGHARALLAVGNEREMTDLARQIVARGLTVRDVERMAREAGPRDTKKARDKPGADHGTAETRRIEAELRKFFQTDVHLSLVSKDKGSIRIDFYSADDLERLLELLVKKPWEGT